MGGWVGVGFRLGFLIGAGYCLTKIGRVLHGIPFGEDQGGLGLYASYEGF